MNNSEMNEYELEFHQRYLMYGFEMMTAGLPEICNLS
jgi:hypothetical protein